MSEVTQEQYANLIFTVDGISDPESEAFMRGFAYGRFTRLDSELALHWGVSRDRQVEDCPIVADPVNLLAQPTTPASEDEVGRIKQWALEKASQHHKLAVEDEHLRTEHIASSSAYRSLAEEIAAMGDGRQG